MGSRIPPKLLQSSYRKEMWKNVEKVVQKIEKVLPISSVHLMGSFVSTKRRPADVDFVVMLHTPVKLKNKKWSFDLVIAPDNKHGRELLEDNKKWMRQKYGAKKSEVMRYR
ncbi:MAG: hypothetical protein HY435_01445 [Candidatus Liptonbacteria bacterium]|nr:hypothetical protein [Candidatus Liptonbacteria bacterium]